LTRRSRGFSPKYRGRDLFTWPVKRSKADFSLDYERLLAARWAGYDWQSFQKMEGNDQAEIVAAYRIEQRISALEMREMMPPRKKSRG
jgi:hypothetical protein